MAYGGIQEFYRLAQERQFNRDFQLRVTTWSDPNVGLELGEDDLLLLRSATLPQIQTSIQQAPFMGMNFNVPGTTVFPGSQNWGVEFYSTQIDNIRSRFEQAILERYNYIGDSSGNLQLPNLGESIVELALVDDNLEPIDDRIYTLEGAFVTQLADVNYNMTANGAIQSFGATVAYQYWYSTSMV